MMIVEDADEGTIEHVQLLQREEDPHSSNDKVLKRSSLTQRFLNWVSPQYACRLQGGDTLSARN
jgi:hypothetical protein